VRELKNQVKRLVILGNVDELLGYLKGTGGFVTERRIGEPAGRTYDMPLPPGDAEDIVPLKVAAKEATIRAEREMILKALRGTNWNKKKAASLLQVSYKALLYKIKECGIEK